MDITEGYRRMCEKAEEVRRLWNAEAGDFIWVKGGDYWDCDDEKEGCVYTLFESEETLCFDSGISYGRSTDYNEEGYFVSLSDIPTAVWLPRQDQLQKLTGIEAIPTLLSQFNEFVFGNVGYTTQEMCSFIGSCEKLWLVFLMKSRFNKVWNGMGWIKYE